MPATPNIETSQADIAVVSGSSAGDIQLSQGDMLAIFNIPTEAIDVSQADLVFVSKSSQDVQVSQLDVIAVIRGRVDDPAVRAWTFTLDGHDFYVLRLGNDETLVYDLTTEQWSVYSSGLEPYWSVYTGANWVGGNGFAAALGSNIVVGSDANGALFFLDPTKAEDDPQVEGRDVTPFVRRVTGQLVSRGYSANPMYEVQLLGSLNQEALASNLDVELLYSDDRGDNYVSAGAVTTVPGDYSVRGSWRSLGSFSSPGRLVRIQDFGALTRIDSLTVNLGEGNGS